MVIHVIGDQHNVHDCQLADRSPDAHPAKYFIRVFETNIVGEKKKHKGEKNAYGSVSLVFQTLTRLYSVVDLWFGLLNCMYLMQMQLNSEMATWQQQLFKKKNHYPKCVEAMRTTSISFN